MRSKTSKNSSRSSPHRQSSGDSTNKRTSDHSKRRRKSSSSSDNSSDRETVLKTTHPNVKYSSSEAEEAAESVVRSSDSSKTKENTKHAAEKTSHSSSKHNHKRTGSHNEDDSRNSRKSRHRHSDESARGDKHEDKDDKTSKGKSKSKHRSKNEKQPQIQDVQAKTESEISENVQVTPQSPQANIDIPVDNDTERDENESNVPLQHETSDVTSSSVIEFSTKPNNNSDSNDSKDYHQHKHSDSDEARQNNENETDIFNIEPNKKETMEWQPMEHKAVLGVPLLGDSEGMDDQEEVSQDKSDIQVETNVAESNSNGASELLMGISESRSKSSSPEAGRSPQTADQEHAPNMVPLADDSSNAGGLHHSDDDSRSVDAIILHESSNTPPRDDKFLLTQSYNSDICDIMDVNNDIQNMKGIVQDMFETPPKPERKHKWGNSLAGLELIKPSMKNITIDTIKEFCPNVAFLEENELRLAAEHREKKSDRRVSMEYKSDEDSRRYETQSSHEDANSETDNSNIIAMNRKISIVEDTASKMRPPPSPARNPISPILYITNLVRPFTVKQLKELLERTGRIRENGFWTDRIKSKCYVHYESSEDAEATRNALHRVNWPIGNGKQLAIEYSTFEELEKARNPAPTPAALEKPPNVPKENIEKQVAVKRPRHEEPEKVHKERERRRSEGQHVREWIPPPREEVRNRRSHSRRHSRNRETRRESMDQNDKRRNRRTGTPPGDYRSKRQKMKEDEPQKLMDDLFHKTKAVPSVYWLPLTPEEIATKQQERLLRMAEHKRRIEESTRNRGDHGRGAPYRRRYD